LPLAFSNEKMNACIKESGKKAALNESIEVISTKGGKWVREDFKKYELIFVYTARRSFSSTAYLLYVPTISIMKIIGH
jgi:hypothetical protein